MMLLTCFLMLLHLINAKQCKPSLDSTPGRRLKNHVIKQEIASNGAVCLQRCMKKRKCYSINYKSADKVCQLSDGNKLFSQGNFVRDDHHFYMENPEKSGKIQSCLDVQMSNPSAKSGYYQILLGSQTTTVYCDMSSHGGGWTLVATISNANHDHLTTSKHNCFNASICVPVTGGQTRKFSDEEIHHIIGEQGIFRVEVKHSTVYDVFYEITQGPQKFNSSCSGSDCPRLIVSHFYPYKWESNCKGTTAGYKLKSDHYVFDTYSDSECGSVWTSSRGLTRPYRALYGAKGFGNNGGLYQNLNGNLFVR